MSNDNMTTIIGIDISTTCTAICALDDTGSIKAIEHVLTNRKGQTLYSKAEAVKTALQGILEGIEGEYSIYVEAPLSAAANKTTAHTLMTLQRYNGMICMLLREMTGVEPISVHASTARKTCGWVRPITTGLSSHHKKKAIKDSIIALTLLSYTQDELGYEKTKNDTWKSWCGDRADAVVMAMHGQQQA